jgi:hypothetical protein
VKRRRQDSGFAMLLVFLMAACVAITLYIEVPRVAFEAERQRELLLVDRGNQFKRAIQVFVTDKTNNPMRRYPATIDELENFNNHRYLRRRYKDPMTGKDEWRLVHINGGVLTDSVTTQAKTNLAGGSTTSSGSTYVSEQAYIDVPTGDNGGGAGGINRALNRRPSEGAGAPGDPNNPGASRGRPPTRTARVRVRPAPCLRQGVLAVREAPAPFPGRTLPAFLRSPACRAKSPPRDCRGLLPAARRTHRGNSQVRERLGECRAASGRDPVYRALPELDSPTRNLLRRG